MIAPTAPTATASVAPSPSGGWFTQLARLVRWELFLVWRRRTMLITLSAMLLGGYALIMLVQYALYVSARADSPSTRTLSEALGFPGAMGIGGSYIADAGVLLFVVLAGGLIGSEYSYSTLRLSLARGVGRGQLLAAQIIALALLALTVTGLALLVSALMGLLNIWLGLRPSLSWPAGGLFTEVMAYWLALAFNIFAYSLIALWIGTLTRSVVGAIAGPLVFIVIEVVTRGILTVLTGVQLNSPLLNTISDIPGYLMGVNTGALITLASAGPYPFTSDAAPVDVGHALMVSAVYCGLFILISYLALRSRDVLE